MKHSRRRFIFNAATGLLVPFVAPKLARAAYIMGSHWSAFENAEVEAWYGNVLTAGSSVSSATLSALETLVSGLKSDSVWTKIIRCNAFAGDDFDACMIALKPGSGDATEDYYNWNGDGTGAGQFQEDTGLTFKKSGDSGSIAYFYTNLYWDDFTQNDTHMSFYVMNASSTGLRFAHGYIGTDNFAMFAPHNNVNYYAFSDMYDDDNSNDRVQGATSGYTGGIGLITGTRVGSADHRIFVRDTQKASGLSAITAPTFTHTPLAVGGYYNGSGVPDFRGTVNPVCGWYSMGDGLTSTDVGNLWSRVNTFQTSLGRNVT